MLKLHALHKRMSIAQILASAVLPPQKGSMGKLMLVSHHFRKGTVSFSVSSLYNLGPDTLLKPRDKIAWVSTTLKYLAKSFTSVHSV